MDFEHIECLLNIVELGSKHNPMFTEIVAAASDELKKVHDELFKERQARRLDEQNEINERNAQVAAERKAEEEAKPVPSEPGNTGIVAPKGSFEPEPLFGEPAPIVERRV